MQVNDKRLKRLNQKLGENWQKPTVPGFFIYYGNYWLIVDQSLLVNLLVSNCGSKKIWELVAQKYYKPTFYYNVEAYIKS